MTIWADLAPWLLAMTGVLTVTKGVSKILAKSRHPDFAKWSTRVEASGEISTGLVAFLVFCLWVTQYADDPLWALKVVATSVGLLLVVCSLSASAILAPRLALTANPNPRLLTWRTKPRWGQSITRPQRPRPRRSRLNAPDKKQRSQSGRDCDL